MAQKKSSSGRKAINQQIPFIGFNQKNAEFHGIFGGIQEKEDKINAGKTQTVWLCKAIEDYSYTSEKGRTVEVHAGDWCLIPEKATMVAARLNLEKGNEFWLTFTGEEKGQNGKKFKNIIVEVPEKENQEELPF